MDTNFSHTAEQIDSEKELRNAKRKFIVNSLLSAVILFTFLLSFEYVADERLKQQQQIKTTEYLADYRSRLETILNNNIKLSTGITAYLANYPDSTQQQFSNYVSALLTEEHQIRNIGAAKDLVVNLLYPLQGNEKAIGLDYRSNPIQRDAALKAIELNKTVIAGPLELVQGGIAIIARTPIWVAKDGSNWGLLSVVLDYDAILKKAGISDDMTIPLAIRGRDSLGAQGDVFFGDPAIFNASPQTLTITLPEGSWQIAALPKQAPALSGIHPLAWFMGLILEIFLTLLFHQSYRSRQLLILSTEKQLKSEQVFRNIFVQHDTIMMLIEHESGRVIDANIAASDFYGYTRKQMRNMSIFDINQLSKEDVEANLNHAFNRSENVFVFPHKLANGEIRIVEVHSSPMEYEHKPLVFSVIFDVTKKVEQERRLKLNAIAFENCQEGIIVADENRLIVSVNRGFFKITGYRAEEVIGKNPNFLNSGRQDQVFYDRMFERLRDHGVWKGEIWNKKKDGTVYPELLSITKVVDDQQNITNYVGVFSDITYIKQSEHELTRLAHYDTLTNLPNRLLLNSRIAHAIELHKRNTEVKLGVLFLDLDDFKMINDSLGHHVGDELLKQVAHRLSSRAREQDTVARLGGDEFVVLIEAFGEHYDLSRVAEDIIHQFSFPFELGERETHITTSIGIARFPEDATQADKLLTYADSAMYRAKREGRNRFAFYTQSMTEEAEQKLAVVSELKSAIANDELELYLQPQFILENDQLVGAEALIRWNHPSGKLLTPDKFIPLAEEKGIITEITQWALQKGCELLKHWQQLGKDYYLAINVSAKDIESPDFIQNVENAIIKHGIDAKLLEIELTENSIMSKEEHVQNLTESMSNLGLSIALDDFGTGYSSLSYLKHFKFTKLKIDRAFVADIEKSEQAQRLVNTIIDMGLNFGLKVIAEGVETEQQKAILKMKKCDYAQGFLYSKPITQQDFETTYKI